MRISAVALRSFISALLLSSTATASPVLPLLVTADDPFDPRYFPPADAGSGVARMVVEREGGSGVCAGSLLATGMHLLTAAHCVTDSSGSTNALSSIAIFLSSKGEETIEVSGYAVHPDWTGDLAAGGDLAVLTLRQQLPAGIERYELYRDANDVGAIAEIAGYGTSGTGETGAVDSDGLRRVGRNRFDATMETTLGLLEGGWTGGSRVLISDFDDGSAAHDALGVFFGINDTGLGADEVNPAPGDSGAPGLIGDRIAGISSFATRLTRPNGSTSDIDSSLNWSYGEVSGFTRISAYDAWLDQQLTPIPEPATSVLVLISMFAAGAVHLLRSRSSERSQGTDANMRTTR